jgi:hypothetical protein
MFTSEEKETFKQLFNKYCLQERTKGNCTGHECTWCPIDTAYNEIFHANDDEE